jgi:Icc-related predicted phosphoesterase
MRLALISDTHGIYFPKVEEAPEADVFIHAGDMSLRGRFDEVLKSLNWIAELPYEHKIVIGGNHDRFFEIQPDFTYDLMVERGIIYLCNNDVTLDSIKFWGSPYTPEFMNWAFMLPRGGEALKHTWNRIPLDTDVLITHGPAFEHLDQVSLIDKHLGCYDLKLAVEKVRPAIHVFGHIHGGHGYEYADGISYLNVAALNEDYKPLHSFTSFSIKSRT